MKYSLGRLPRQYSPRIPHFSALFSKLKLDTLPESVDWAYSMPKTLGMYLNDELGNCTCAAFYHARQIWNYNSNKSFPSDPEQDALKLYELAAGYVPGDVETDQGATCQSILEYLYNKGAPIGSESTRDKILGFIEVDPRNLEDVQRTIYECGVAYIGINVPDYIIPEGGEPPELWRVENTHAPILGGHCVVLHGYTGTEYDLISWGRRYQVTEQFLHYYLDECYGIIDRAWFNSSSETPFGLTSAQVEQQMSAIQRS